MPSDGFYLFSVIFPTLVRVIFVSCNIDLAISFFFPTQYFLWFAGIQRPKPMTLCDLIPVCLSGLATLPRIPPLSHSALNLPLPSVTWGRCLSFSGDVLLPPLFGLAPAHSSCRMKSKCYRLLREAVRVPPEERRLCLHLRSHSLWTGLHVSFAPQIHPKYLLFIFTYLLISKMIGGKMKIMHCRIVLMNIECPVIMRIVMFRNSWQRGGGWWSWGSRDGECLCCKSSYIC